ncbi:MAG: glucose-1-phosphate thymidylyltransferase [Methanobacteriota archaeon]|nr:MAG: glucose-1-phosphate thymidylyltransferase [Euryarchaeota archaeon]
MKGLILAGGAGTGLRPLTHTGPKQLIPIANKPNILYCLEDVRDAGITEIGVILGENMPEKVEELLGDGSSYGVKITYIVQGAPRGIAHAVGCAREFVGNDPFVVYLGDNLLRGGIREMAEEFLEGDAEAQVALCKVPNPQRFGVAELDEDGNIVSLVEKPKEPKSDLALVGIYFFQESVFPIIDELKPSWRNELEITEAIDNLRTAGNLVKAHVVSGWWKDTGRPEDILEANQLILQDLETSIEGDVAEDVETRGNVSIGKGSKILPGSVIKGPVVVGENCEIGPKTYVGPYTSIGDNTRLVGGEIEDTIVVGDCVIDCGRRIVHSLIGRHSSILSSEGGKPAGHRLILGENSSVMI